MLSIVLKLIALLRTSYDNFCLKHFCKLLILHRVFKNPYGDGFFFFFFFFFFSTKSTLLFSLHTVRF